MCATSTGECVSNPLKSGVTGGCELPDAGARHLNHGPLEEEQILLNVEHFPFKGKEL